jgi:hypothetical protein
MRDARELPRCFHDPHTKSLGSLQIGKPESKPQDKEQPMRFFLNSPQPGRRTIKPGTGTVAMVALTSFLFCGATAPTGCVTTTTPAPAPASSKAPVIGAVVAVVGIGFGTAVLIEAHRSHNIKGCVLAGPGGLQLQDDGDMKIYDLAGTTADVKVGDQVRVHGDKKKKEKGATDQIFAVQKLNRDYGPCKVSVTQNASNATTPAPVASPAP